jgi:Gas vesicle synthesis protein GvpL/GvpF
VTGGGGRCGGGPGGGLATYVFAVCRGCSPAALDGVAGHGAPGPVRLLPVGRLQVVVQDVPAEAFSAEALRARLADREQLEACARAHHRVVCAVAAHAPVLPLPLATLYLGDARVREAFADGERRFGAALDRIAGRAEWGVKVHTVAAGPPESREVTPAAGRGLGPRSTAASGSGSVSGAGSASGRAYLDRARGLQQARERRHDAALRAADTVDGALRELAVAARRLRPHGVEITGRGRTQVLNAAYLVDQERGGELAEAVGRLMRRPELRGVEIDLSGPWPPYSFADGEGGDDGGCGDGGG